MGIEDIKQYRYYRQPDSQEALTSVNWLANRKKKLTDCGPKYYARTDHISSMLHIFFFLQNNIFVVLPLHVRRWVSVRRIMLLAS